MSFASCLFTQVLFSDTGFSPWRMGDENCISYAEVTWAWQEHEEF